MLVNAGAVCEQLIGQHLLFSRPFYEEPDLHYWTREKRSSSAEVDYVISEGARIIPNPLGSAPGIELKVERAVLFVLPGVPSEMKPMIEGWVTDAIKERSGGVVTIHKKLRTVGIIESALYEKVSDLIDPKKQPREAKISVAFCPPGAVSI